MYLWTVYTRIGDWYGTGAARNFSNLSIINNLKRSHAAYNSVVTSSLCSRVW